MQQSAFSGARCAHDGDHFSLIDMQADVAQHLYGLPTLVIGLDQISRGERMDGDGISHDAEPVRVASWTRASLDRSEEHTSELQSLMRISYAVFCLKKKKTKSITSKMNIKYLNK